MHPGDWDKPGVEIDSQRPWGTYAEKDEGEDFKEELTVQKTLFKEEADKLQEEYKGQNIDVTKLENFKKTAIFQDKEGKILREGDNSGKAIFMTLFG